MSRTMGKSAPHDPHDVPPAVGENLLDTQSVQEEEPSTAEMDPMGQSTCTLEPSFSQYLPALQEMHSCAPSKLYIPLEHFAQTVKAVTDANVPAAHLVQDVVPTSGLFQNVPLGQNSHWDGDILFIPAE